MLKECRFGSVLSCKLGMFQTKFRRYFTLKNKSVKEIALTDCVSLETQAKGKNTKYKL